MTLAFVTGGSRGLGFATAKALRTQGIEVVLFATEPKTLENSAKSIGAKFQVINFLDLEKSQETLMRALVTFGTPDIVILAHGVMSEKLSKTMRTTLEEWNRVITVNMDSVFLCMNILGPGMVEKRAGRFIVYSACLGRMSGPGNTGGLAPYRVSKAGVNALVRNFAHETGLGARGVLVDAICPNHTRTDMGGPNAPRSVEEGADTAIWLATRDFDIGKDITGVLWEDRKVIPW